MASKRTRFFALFGALLFLFTSSALTIAIIYSSTQQPKTDTKTATNKKENSKMLQGNPLPNFTPVSSITELKTEDTTPGTGDEVLKGDTITADYTGAIAATGIVFQSSLDSGKPFTTGLSGVIKGWQEGIPGMKEGGTRRLYIPAALAYGSSSPSADIPANADLVFDVTVHKTSRS